MFGLFDRLLEIFDPYRKLGKNQVCLLRTGSRVVPSGVVELRLLHFDDGVEKLLIKTDPRSLKSFVTSEVLEKVFRDNEYIIKTGGGSEYRFRLL